MPTLFKSYFPESPGFTEKDLPNLDGKVDFLSRYPSKYQECHPVDITISQVYIITGGTNGIGLGLAKILYHANASRIYILSRSASSSQSAIEAIKSSLPHPSVKARTAPGAKCCPISPSRPFRLGIRQNRSPGFSPERISTRCPLA